MRPCHFHLLRRRRCSRNRSPSRLPLSPRYKFFLISASYAVNDIGGGPRKVIGDPNESLRSFSLPYE